MWCWLYKMIYNSMIHDVYEKDSEFQISMLNAIAEQVRSSPIGDTFIQNQFLYIPDDNYLPSLVGDYITDKSLGLYNYNKELYHPNKLYIPIRNFRDEVVGFAFYDNQGQPKYSIQRTLTNIRKYLNIRPSQYLQGLEEGYLCISDGFMDKFHQEHYGLPSCSIFGSNLSKEQIQYLKPFKHLILFMDNDNAGVGLADKLKQAFPSNLTVVKQSKGKDSDDYLKVSPQSLVDYVKNRRQVWLPEHYLK